MKLLALLPFLGMGFAAQAQETSLPAGWFPLILGAYAQSHEGLGVFHVMYESEAPLFDDLPVAATHAQLLDDLAVQCQTSEMAAEIARIRETFLKMGIPQEKLFEAIRMSVRHDGTASDGTRLVTVFETLHDLNDDGTCGASRAAAPVLLWQEPEARYIRG
jgi:hypothetical protein